ncbi:MAG: ADP-glyceromanno-heptose 6-epimerase [Bacteroidales bacterium]|nr:ADP-glyceromanno-heptose 6-epimerase [Bacteroidales bacterium]MCF8337708.1 ADP-glyceromanno-heptose 6-epimerase [Bacteroidales bacterium]
MIIVTGAYGFIGSALVTKLNNEGYNDLVMVDDFSKTRKEGNLKEKAYHIRIERDDFLSWLEKNSTSVTFIFHIGARTDTAEFDKAVFDKLNLNYTKSIWQICSEQRIPLVYASSAATYGLGEQGYDDRHDIVDKLQPLNAYGESKNEFDKWALKQNTQPPFWAGMKFFNVYGSNEYHKGRMASVIFHAYHQIVNSGKVKLFRSHNPDYKDGEQLRDFVYIKDVVDVLYFMMQKQPLSGLYNLGTGKARTFIDLAESTFQGLDKKPDIQFIDTPQDIRDKYQYFTEANMEKLFSVGYTKPFHSLEEGVDDYVRNYLAKGKYY